MSVQLPTLEEMATAGVHFGHRTRQWNPKMEEYIYDVLDGIHLINLEKTQAQLQQAIDFLVVEKAGQKNVVFVGTKRQAAPIIRRVAENTNSYYVADRWPGGLITNFKSVGDAIRSYEELSAKMEDPIYLETLSSKEKSVILKKLERLNKIFAGLKGLTQPPDIIIAVDPRRERTAIAEAKLKGLTTIGIVDTNTDPSLVDYPIPANDDALKSIELILNTLANTLLVK